MKASSTWTVRPSRFPFGVSVEVLGEVQADNRKDAQRKAEDHYGRDVVVELTSAGSNGSEHTRQNGASSSDRTNRVTARGQGLLEVEGPDSQRRDMTADEALMARAVASCPLISKSEHRARIRMLHARTFTATRTITGHEAKLLRAIVIAFKTRLDPNVVALAEEPIPPNRSPSQRWACLRPQAPNGEKEG